MAETTRGSLTKEPPLEKLDATLSLIRPGMTYDALRAIASAQTHPVIPALLRNRFLTVRETGQIQYDGLLSLINTYGVSHPRVRKVMYFVWAWRDDRIRKFILERIVDANGRWRPAAVIDKSNASFFEQFMTVDSAKKARSNYEFFLVEAGIFNPATKKVGLDLEDGWLSDAVAIAASHEPPEIQALMVTDPVGFLFSRNANGLANLSKELRPENVPGELESLDWIDDARIANAAPTKAHTSHAWAPRNVAAIQGKVREVLTDLIAVERASLAHQNLERLLAGKLKKAGQEPRFNANIDMFYSAANAAVIFELKSCHSGNLHAQIRRGVAQLLEYRYLNRDLLGSADLCLVLETSPPANKHWLVKYLSSLGITTVWRTLGGDFATTAEIPASLESVVKKG